ncbi:MAG: hypothetical protein GY815_05680 [Gammaproteobacteria bacterium]|nr:hypothetical protein [Gammaproteobacteria bacterium]
MSTLELLAKAAGKTPRYGDLLAGGHGDITWQDVLQALQGVSLAKTSFALYLIVDDKTCRHYFWAGLFMEVMQRPELVARPDLRQPGEVEALCQLAVMEWGGHEKYSNTKRAAAMNVSRGTWYRRHKDTYHEIYKIPGVWQLELEQLLRQRLR